MNELVKTEPRAMITAEQVNPISMMFDPVIAERVKAIAQTMAMGKFTVPEHLHDNLGDCLAIVMQAATWRMNPFSVAQKTHLIHGRLGYEAQLVSAVTSTMGILEGRFSYKYEGNWSKLEKPPRIAKSQRGAYPEPGWKPEDEAGLAIIVTGKLRGESEPKSMRMALASVWPRNSGLWATDPKQQGAYLITKKWVRLYAPDAILGVYTPDELQEESMQRADQWATPSSASAEVMARARALEKQGMVVDASLPALSEDEEEEGDEEDEWPQTIDGALVDKRFVPWHRDHHSKNKKCNDDGTWRKRRGVNVSLLKEYETPFLPGSDGEKEDHPEQEDLVDAINNATTSAEQGPTEQSMLHAIKNATSSAELEALTREIIGVDGWDVSVKDRLVEQARNYKVDWIEVERAEK